MSSYEFAEWVEHYRREPWGEYRIDLASAGIQCMLANINRDTKRKPTPFALVDFMPFMEKPKGNPAAELRASLLHLVKKKAA